MIEGSYDLTDCSRRRYAITRSLRIEFATISIGLATTGLVILIFQLTHGTIVSSLRLLYGVPYLVAFSGAVFMGWGSTKFGPGATLIKISEVGVSFTFPSRGTSVLRWVDRRFKLNIVDARGTWAAQRHTLVGFARVPHRPSTSLTPEALEGIVAGAQSHQLSITTRKRGGRWSIAGPTHVWVEIRASSS